MSHVPKNCAIGTIYHAQQRAALLSGSVSQTQLWGFMQLIGLIFVVTNCREIVANCLKYGWVVRWLPQTVVSAREHCALMVGVAVVGLVGALAYWLELRRGRAFAATWAAAIKDMQKVELEAQLLNNKHNIYNLRPPEPKGEPQACADEAPLTETPSPTPGELHPPVNEKLAEDPSFGSLMDADSDSEDSTSLRGLWHRSQRYIDYSRVDGVLSAAESYVKSAESYVKTQQKKLETLKNEVGDLITKTPLVTVYNTWSKKISERHSENVHCIKASVVCSMMLGLPYFVVLTTQFDPLSSLFLLMLSCTWCLKLVSFFHTLHDLRLVILSDPKALIEVVPFSDERDSYLHYPTSLSFKHYLTFLIAPTLCFQFNYPRKAKRDYKRIGLTFSHLLFSLILLKIIFEQYVSKILENTFSAPQTDGGLLLFVGHFAERFLKLTIPTLYCWLLMFISFFHYWMIFLAEVVRFEDQMFYKDWWNACSFAEYWRKWNLPVHHFCVRHVYTPLLQAGWSKNMAGQTVFVLSALAHEHIVAGSLKLGWTGLVFLGFIMQTPLAILTESKWVRSRPYVGNALFWIVFCLTGQPMGVLIFYYMWHLKSGWIQPLQIPSVHHNEL